jgi:hypothetical protein
MHALLLAGLPLLATACYGSDSVVYTPTGASVWNDGYPAAVVAVPPGASTGTLEIASFGFVELTPADMSPMTTFHVRLAAANTGSDRPWNVDVRGATLRVGETDAHPLLVNGDLETLPIALVERGEPRTLDLYFPLPAQVRDEEDLAALDFSVQLAAPGRTARVQTHFTRRDPTEVAGPRKEAARVAGWGNRWWADPAYAWPTFHRRPGILTPKPPAQATVNRLPRWQRAPQPWSARR